MRKHHEYLTKHGQYTTVDITGYSYNECELLRVLLNETVLDRALKLPADDSAVMLKSHLAFLRYFRDNPSRPSVGEQGSGRAIEGLAIDCRRLAARLEAVRLPWSDYKVYAKIANTCRVPMSDALHKMRFGEVRRSGRAPWAYDPGAVRDFGGTIFDHPTTLIAASCRAFVYGGKTMYCAVIRDDQPTLEKDAVSLYCCVWDEAGFPLALHPLRGDAEKPLRKIKTVKVEDHVLCIVPGTDGGPTILLPIGKRNRNNIPAADIFSGF